MSGSHWKVWPRHVSVYKRGLSRSRPWSWRSWHTSESAVRVTRTLGWDRDDSAPVRITYAHYQITWRTRSLSRRHDRPRDCARSAVDLVPVHPVLRVSRASCARPNGQDEDRQIAGGGSCGVGLASPGIPPGPVATAVRHDRQINDQISMEAFPAPHSPRSPAFL